jgi:hypothetical protein
MDTDDRIALEIAVDEEGAAPLSACFGEQPTDDPQDHLGDDDDEDGGFCEVEGCESPATETKPASVGLAEVTTRKMCWSCGESYGIGAQHGTHRSIRWLLRHGFDEAAAALHGRPISPEERAAVLAMDPNDEYS